ncbi:MAG: hypothetical protein WCO25_00830 [Candidatus Uhrbacteria bacterium]
MEQEMRQGVSPEQAVAEHSPAKRWSRNPRLESLFRNRPEVGERLEEILRHPVMVDALKRATRKDPEALAHDLADAFRASFPDLGDRVPTSIDTIDFRSDAPDPVGGTGTTGNAGDYLMQRLMGTLGFADLAKQMPLSSELQLSFDFEADKLATFLVALDRAKPPADEKLAA